MTLPRKINCSKEPKVKRRFPAHLKFVREYRCAIECCEGLPIEAAHVRSGTDGGASLKPSDWWTISLCAEHHRQQHDHGERAFEMKYNIDMKKLATEFARKSRHVEIRRHAGKRIGIDD